MKQPRRPSAGDWVLELPAAIKEDGAGLVPGQRTVSQVTEAGSEECIQSASMYV